MIQEVQCLILLSTCSSRKRTTIISDQNCDSNIHSQASPVLILLLAFTVILGSKIRTQTREKWERPGMRPNIYFISVDAQQLQQQLTTCFHMFVCHENINKYRRLLIDMLMYWVSGRTTQQYTLYSKCVCINSMHQ